jgi:hypothetical protein
MPNRRHKHPKISLVGDFMSMSNTISKIGAVSYIIWACLHLLAAYSVYVLGRSLDSSIAWNLLVPGYTPVWPSILGPVFWVLATIFSTIALLMRTKGATRTFTGDNTELKHPQ